MARARARIVFTFVCSLLARSVKTDQRNFDQNLYRVGYHIREVRGGSYTDDIQSAKIVLLPPKYEIIMVPSNHSFFQYCDSNIGLFSIAPCNVITLNPICILFGSFLMALFLKLSLFKLSR